ncbi:MAG: Wzz/FepE/Etk N-terminal domain-containing protein [Rubrobacteraceae bacterium]
MRSTSPFGRSRNDLSLREVLYVLWGRRTLVAGVVVALLAGALLFSLSREPVYTAEAIISVTPRQQGLSQGEREAFLDDVLNVVADDELLGNVVEEVGWRGEVSEFRERLDPETFVDQDERSGIAVRFSGTDPEASAASANAYSSLFVEKVERLNERRLAGGVLAAEASVERQAAPPSFRSSPRPLLYALAAVGVGVLIGGGAALRTEGRARNWRDARDAEMTLQAPVIGVIPDYSVLDGERAEP